MTLQVYERRTRQAVLVLSLEDSYAESRTSPNALIRPLEPIQFFLIRQDVGGAVTQFDPPVLLEMIRNPSGYHLFFGNEQVRVPSPLARQGGLPVRTRRLNFLPGDYTVRITSPFYQTVEKPFRLPIINANLPGNMDAYTVLLDPGYAYPFQGTFSLGQVPAADCAVGKVMQRGGPMLLRGILLDTIGQGIPGATVRVAGRSNPYVTDETGQWVLWFSDRQRTGPVTVHMDIPGGTPPSLDVQNVCVVAGCETVLRQTSLRGWVRKGNRGLAGAAITLAGLPQATFTDSEGSWTLVLPFTEQARTVQVQAALPDGSSQSQDTNIVPGATVMVTTFQFP